MRRLAALKAITTGPPEQPRWPLRYYIRRTVWHVFDHAWEIEDKSG